MGKTDFTNGLKMWTRQHCLTIKFNLRAQSFISVGVMTSVAPSFPMLSMASRTISSRVTVKTYVPDVAIYATFRCSFAAMTACHKTLMT